MDNTNHLSRSGVNILFRILICLLLLAFGVAGMIKLASLKSPPKEKLTREQAMKVEIIKVQPEEVPIVLSGYGEVKPLDVVSIAPEVSGRIIDINPDLDSRRGHCLG